MRLLSLALLALCLAGCAAARGERLALEPLADFPSLLSESSGLAAWRGGLLSHNDSGKPATLFALSAAGKSVRSWPVPAGNRDWEDIAVHGDDIYLADTGNNGGQRRDLAVYRLQLAAGTLQLRQRLPVAYAEQGNFRPPRHQHNFDAEALAWVDGELWLLTKRWLDEDSALYKLPAEGGKAPLIEQQRLATAMLVTGADYDAASQTLLLLGYSRHWLDRRAFLWLYPVRDGRVEEAQGRRWQLSEGGQFEGITLGEDGFIYLSREGGGSNLFRSRQPLAELLPTAAPAQPRR
ncbi:hypothetical protein C7H85_10085 [Zobellella endophytica]|uniref:Phytase-like domain-containing protein n=1 Tax=Zobellella endophytica TaxID=2116700 RepID=A0A2P7R674_9GAMM|nr:hypothetical protein [Zobellella endophytica]PSJ45719.1 hypothetical protein C7H85_10085 [Zobellella endophytica]